MKVYSFQSQGNRPYQEDYYYISEDKNLHVLCDGVGGSSDGAFGSKTVIEAIKEKYLNGKKPENPNDIKEYISIASNELIKTGIENVATTIALLFINNTKAWLTHIGDSRIYYISNLNSKRYVTKDHSIVQELFNAGILESEEAMKKHPFRNRITQALNTTDLYEKDLIDVVEFSNIEKGDMFFLCSDGAIENYTNDQVFGILSNNDKGFENKCRDIEQNSNNTSNDNSTGIIIEL